MNSNHSASTGGPLGGLPSDGYYVPAPIAWTKRAWWMVTLAGLIAALALVLAVALGIVPMFFGFRTFVVVSGSMEPTIATGSIAMARSVPSQNLRIGDVIAFSPSSEASLPIIHRIVKIEERHGVRYFTTRGDANSAPDASLALPSTSLLVVSAIPWVGYAVYYAAQPAGTIVLVWTPLVLLAALWLKDRVVKWRQARHA